MAKTSTTKKTAKKKTSSSKKVSKHYPVQRMIRPEEVTSGAVAHVIRSDKLLSNVNHRLYRQSRVYSVNVGISPDWDDGASQFVNVYVLSDTWMNQKAYQMAYKQFVENSKEELAQLGSSKARWNDFRVDHGLPIGALNFSETKAYQFEPDGGVPNDHKVFLDEGEYLMSEVTDNAGVKHSFKWTGAATTTTFNIIDEYDLTGNTSADPNVPLLEVAYDELSDEVDDNQMTHLSADGNLPPYSETDLPNACWVLAATLRAGGPETAKMNTGFINAPCGLIIIEGTSAVMDGVTLNYKAGDYKGVHAPSYLE
jgi:hypothetical protein